MINVINRAIFFLLAIALCAPVVMAERREIVFPIPDGIVDSQRTNLAFAHGGQIGFAIVTNQSTPSAKLFSFSVLGAEIISEINLAPDFSLADASGNFQLILLDVHSNTGLVVVSGRDSNRVQKLMALSADKSGHMRKLWVSSFPASSFPPQVLNLSFNRHGSRIYFIYSSNVEENSLLREVQSAKQNSGAEIDSNIIVTGPESGAQFIPNPSAQARSSSPFRQHLALIRTEDGATLSTMDLSTNQTSSVMFNEARNRPVVLTKGRVFIFSPESDQLEVESIIEPPSEIGEVVGQAFSQNGRFLIGYAGTGIGPKTLQNEYVSYDLELRNSHRLSVENSHFPAANGLVFHQATRTMFVPLSVKVKITPGGAFVFIASGSRLTDVISLAFDGSLGRVAQIKIPNRSPGSLNPNRIMPQTNSLAISATGALGFLSSQNGYLFTFDTFTREIINDELIDPQTISSIHLLESMGLVVTANGTNKLLLVGVSTGPVVESIQIKNGLTIIKGANFLSGARVEINGVEVGPVNLDPDKPGRELIIERGKNDFQKGESYAFVVINRDGLKSKPFTLIR